MVGPVEIAEFNAKEDQVEFERAERAREIAYAKTGLTGG
jgi:hypothetical protein